MGVPMIFTAPPIARAKSVEIPKAWTNVKSICIIKILNEAWECRINHHTPLRVLAKIPRL
jgi:hypothetical protein